MSQSAQAEDALRAVLAQRISDLRVADADNLAHLLVVAKAIMNEDEVEEGLGKFTVEDFISFGLVNARARILYNSLHPPGAPVVPGAGDTTQGEFGHISKKHKTRTWETYDMPNDLSDLSTLSAGNVFLNVSSCELAGLSDVSTKRLRVRPETRAIWDALEANSVPLLQGPPGTGKSIAVWTWACSQANAGSSVSWFHLTATHFVFAVQVGPKDMKSCEFRYSELTHFIKRVKTDILVIDGLTQEKIETLSSGLLWLRDKEARKKSRRGRKLVMTSSQQLSLPSQDTQALKIKTASTCGWTLADYQDALGDDDFWREVYPKLIEPSESADDFLTWTREARCALVEHKFFWAGFSARWMWALSLEEAIEDIDTQYSRMGTDVDKWLNGLGGQRNSQAVNHMFTCLSGSSDYLVVSQYVTRRMAQDCDLDLRFIKAATAQAAKLGNQAFDGWVFEMDFFAQQRLAQKNSQPLLVTNKDGVQEQWQVVRTESFNKIVDLAKITEVADGLWLNPQKWNQGGFDVAYLNLSPKCCLGIVQITLASTHALKLQYAIDLIETLKAAEVPIEEIHVVVLLPAGHDCFTLGSVYSQKAKTILEFYPDGWNSENLHVRYLARSRA
eukprot:TRINITY_DN225_c0_g1_i1.p1 TRINITY_DN225_c0_g1~~TRINITY_DN225_c0_g1_i1.p1  ORF type:complete len:615 (+),score=105.31 TRINITY_DN225_c0_g1_i1:182-2026(+)